MIDVLEREQSARRAYLDKFNDVGSLALPHASMKKGYSAMGIYPIQESALSPLEIYVDNVKRKISYSSDSSSKKSRTLVLADIENLGVGDETGSHMMWDVLTCHLGFDKVENTDYIAGTCIGNKDNLNGIPSHVKKVVGEGKDAAETELIKAVDWSTVPLLYSHVVIASGDKMFIPVVMFCREFGIKVTIISRSASAHKGLLSFAHFWIRPKLMETIRTAVEARKEKRAHTHFMKTKKVVFSG